VKPCPGSKRARGGGLAPALVVLALLAGACRDEAKDTPRHATPPPATVDPQKADTPPAARREAFFGDLHVHTGWSLDAYDQGVRTGPDDAYRFARGETIEHAAGYRIELAGPPLDFLAVTDHAEYLGVANAALRGAHPLHRQPLIQDWIGDDARGADLAGRTIRQSLQARRPFPALVAADVLDATWREVVEIAKAHDRPGTFTTFVGFEYSANPDFQNLHRNVIFRGAKVPPRPFSAFDSSNPEDLWHWMDRVRSEGDDLIAIPHNANGSNGLMFAPTRFAGGAIDGAWAEQRLRNEPLAEVFQIKGQSETTPRLSPDDEWANFEVVRWLTLAPNRTSRESGSYVREALSTGLALRETRGFDAFAVGLVGSSDGHNSASPVVESDYFGKLGLADGTPERRLDRKRVAGVGPSIPLNTATFWSAAGLAGIWAPENTRAALFDALRRRETFATSGPRIRLRLLAGFELLPGDARGDLDGLVPAKGVAMGGELAARPGAGSPLLILAAQQDPLEAPLERLQIIKLAPRKGESTEQVFDVACAGGDEPDPSRRRCPRSTPAPDPADCLVSSAGGASELVASWRDPEYDEEEHALYYARVLQVPTCRWSRFDAMRLGRPDPVGVPTTIQERAVSSPIWITPVGWAGSQTAGSGATRVQPTPVPSSPGSTSGDRSPTASSRTPASTTLSIRISPKVSSSSSSAVSTAGSSR
jgi:hypothetical protein